MDKLQFLDINKIPYVYFSLKIENNEKVISDIPPGFMEWDYERCMKYNKNNKTSAININLSKSDFMIIDIDTEEHKEKYLKQYGNEIQTTSTRYNLPHLWRKKHSEDKNTTKTKFQTGLDLLYKNVFEWVEGNIENYTPNTPTFNNFPIVKDTPKKIIKKISSSSIDSGLDDSTSKPPTKGVNKYLNMITNDKKIDYDTWLRIIFSLKNDSVSNYDIAYEWSSTNNIHTDKHFNEVWNYSKPKNSIGTLRYYANLFNPYEYRKLILEKSISENDEFMANVFIDLQSPNIIYTNSDTYIYDNKWIKDDKKNLQLKKIIRKTLINFGLNLEIQNNQQLLKTTDETDYLKIKKKKIGKFIDSVSSSNKINNVTAFIIQDLASENQKIEFDLGEEQKYNLHFKNGVYELNNKKFRPRTQNDYITQILDWDYKPESVTPTIENEIINFYKKLQPNETQRRFSLQWLAYCLTGSTGKQKFKMNIGYSASNGKSTEFKIHDRVFDIYSFKLSKDTFNLNNDKAHKQLIHLIKNPIRFAYCEELKQNKLDVDLLKDFVDGDKLNVEIMYGTSESHSIQCKLNTCSNFDFNVDIDRGILRRGLVQMYESKFKHIEKDDYKNHTYKVIENYANRFDTEIYKNAYLQLLIKNYDEDFKAPVENEKAFDDIANEYDEYGDALSHFEITNDENDIINKNEILEYFKGYIGKTNLKWRELLSTLKSRGVKYNKDKKNNKVKGCCLGIKHIEEDLEEDLE